MDSAYYSAAVIGAIRSKGARFSVTVPVELQHPRRDRRDPRGALDRDPVPAGVWERPAGLLDLRRPRSPKSSTTAFASKKKQAVTAG